jgi:ATP-binding cassette subfamily B multidrug efflux pump
MALRLNGISHWVMWELATLFEHVGTVQDGIHAEPPASVVDAPDAQPLDVRQGEIRFERRALQLRRHQDGHRRAEPGDPPGEKIGLVGRSGAGKSTVVNLLLRFHDLRKAGRILIDGQDIAGVTQDSLRAPGRHGHAGHQPAAPLGARQHPLRPPGRR